MMNNNTDLARQLAERVKSNSEATRSNFNWRIYLVRLIRNTLPVMPSWGTTFHHFLKER